VPRTLGLIGDADAAETPQGALTFVQISDSHIGFHLPPNPNPLATLTEAIDKIKAMPTQPAFDDLIGVFPFLLLGEVADIAGMDHEGRLRRIALILSIASVSVASGFGFGGRWKPDVAVADLHKSKGALRRLGGRQHRRSGQACGAPRRSSSKPRRLPPRSCTLNNRGGFMPAAPNSSFSS